ncbi:DUF1828 domain-containing protein [Methanomassiliicoccales archaeon LGM-RCC1]|nr:DUF1828 domain-containing protein [Methanomassiliicoccales archaeon LGM-RCC1]
MDADELIGYLKKSICSGLEVEPRTVNRFMVHTGYTYPDGDELHILMINEDGGWMFSDEGHTMMWLSYEDFNLTDLRKDLLERTLKTNGVSFKDGALYIPIDTSAVDSIGLSLKSLIQAEIQVADLLYLDKETVKDTFIDDLKAAFSISSLSDRCSYDYRITGDGDTEYYADVYVKSKIPILVFGIHTALQCSRATVAMLALDKSGSQYMFMAVFDNNTQVPARDRNTAINAAIKTTIGLEGAVEGAERLISLQ